MRFAQRDGGGAGRAVGACGGAGDREFVQSQGIGQPARQALAVAAQQGQCGLLQHGGLGTPVGAGSSQHQPGELLGLGNLRFGEQAHAGVGAVPVICTPTRWLRFGRTARMSSDGLSKRR
jgi:hypothetical protein